MRRKLSFAAPVGAVIVIALVAAGCGGGSDQTERTIELSESDQGSTFQEIDNPPVTAPAATPGDEIVITMPLLDPASKERLGTLHATCTTTEGGKSPDEARVLCEGVIELDDGTLTISGLAGKNPVATYAVTGGTDAYEGARGTYREESGKPVAVIHLVD